MPVLSVFGNLLAGLWETNPWKYPREEISKERSPNNPDSSFLFAFNKFQSLQIWTIRNNESVRIEIGVQELEVRFYDDEEVGECCLKIHIHKKLANPEKFQQDFSLFLAAEKPNLINFITETIWPKLNV